MMPEGGREYETADEIYELIDNGKKQAHHSDDSIQMMGFVVFS